MNIPNEPKTGQRTFFAPGRVNLLGEHTDYTGGLVMPMAIPFATHAAIEAVEDGRYHFSSEMFEETRELAADDLSGAVSSWSDYPVGVLRQLQLRGIYPPGFTLRLGGNVPLGAGLSSSASVEVATAMALLWLAGEEMDVREIALMCQRAENDYVGSPCGIMDQFVITAAKEGHALLLDTGKLTYDHVPMNTGMLGETSIVVCNSMVRHSVATGDYGVRRREVEAGQRVLMNAFPDVLDLGAANMEQLLVVKDQMSPESFRRCRHIITENGRVREAKTAMGAGDAVKMGQLMLDAHRSERDDFECSVEEIDLLVDTAASLTGCFGARLTGGGFGGCTVNLVARTQVESFSAALKARYKEAYGVEAEIYVCEAVDGAAERKRKVGK